VPRSAVVAIAVSNSMIDYPYRWRVHTRLPERFGQACRIIPTPAVAGKPRDYPGGAKGSGIVEFDDGYKVITSRRYVRKVKP
jgi:hypothetical protein